MKQGLLLLLLFALSFGSIAAISLQHENCSRQMADKLHLTAGTQVAAKAAKSKPVQSASVPDDYALVFTLLRF